MAHLETSTQTTYSFPYINRPAYGTTRNTLIFTYEEEPEGDHIVVSNELDWPHVYEIGRVYWRRRLVEWNREKEWKDPYEWRDAYTMLVGLGTKVIRSEHMGELAHSAYRRTFAEPVLPRLDPIVESNFGPFEVSLVHYMRYSLNNGILVPESFQNPQ